MAGTVGGYIKNLPALQSS